MDINDIRCDGTRYELNGHQFTVLGIKVIDSIFDGFTI